MTTARRTLAAAAAMVLLALVGSGAALAANEQAYGKQAALAVAAPCDQLTTAIAQLQATRDRVAAAVVATQQRIAGGGLTARQLALARVQLAVLRIQLAVMDSVLAQLKQRQALLCAAGTPPPPPPPPPPPGE